MIKDSVGKWHWTEKEKLILKKPHSKEWNDKLKKPKTEAHKRKTKEYNNRPEVKERARKQILGKKNPMANLIVKKKWLEIIKSPKYKEKLRIAKVNYIGKYGVRILGKNEKKILDNLEILFNYKIIRQFQVIGFFLDGYIQELNLAIEVDEKGHFSNNLLRREDIQRQKLIEEAINCKFLRIKDYDKKI